MGHKKKSAVPAQVDASNLAGQWKAEATGVAVVVRKVPTLAEAMELIMASTVEIMVGDVVQWRGLVPDVKPPPDLWL
jgi:hypothetical protein